MQLYDTLSRQKQELSPLKPPAVTVYTCGPTVYQEPHIGNWRTFIFYDVLVRALRHAGYQPKHVLNITDVGHLVGDSDEGEDKVEKEAKLERKTAWEVAKAYTKLFEAGMKRLNIKTPDFLPKATEHIGEQIKLISALEDKGYTYVIEDGVYFDTSKLSDYGKLAGIDREQQLAGARVESHPDKRHHADFALWKFSPSNQQRDMEWDSPWGKGFPGWHLECSAMAVKYLGETIDIHAGGVDHIGVHHTNEIAQSEAATGQPFARIWLHAEMMQVEGEKMSKSLGNVYLLDDIEAKAPLSAFRLLILSSHYRSQQNFTWDALAGAAERLRDLLALSDLRFQGSNEGQDLKADIDQAQHDFDQALYDDLSLPAALASIDKLGNILSENPINPRTAQSLGDFLDSADQVLGLGLSGRVDINDDQKQLIAERETARQAKNFISADKLRDQLREHGIEINDTEFGPRWQRR